MLGWTVLSQLKQNPLTRHIPVQIITLDEDRQHALARGAFSLRQQADRRPRASSAGAGADQGICAAAPQAAAGRGGQCRRADEHPRAARLTTISRSSPPDTGADALSTLREQPVRLRRARSAPARHDRLRGAGTDPRRRNAVERAGRGVHRPGTDGRGRRAAAHHGAQHRGQGRGVARTAARRNLAVPAPRGHGIAARKAAHAGEAE